MLQFIDYNYSGLTKEGAKNALFCPISNSYVMKPLRRRGKDCQRIFYTALNSCSKLLKSLTKFAFRI